MVIFNRNILRSIAVKLLFTISTIILMMSSASCSHKRDAEDILSEASKMLNEGKYDEALVKAMEAEELFSDDTPLKNRELLSSLYGCIYYQRNMHDKAEKHFRQAVKYAVEMNDSALISRDRYNLGLSATNLEDGFFNLNQAADISRKCGYNDMLVTTLVKLVQAYTIMGEFVKAQSLLDEAARLCRNPINRGEITSAQNMLWFAAEDYDKALEGYKSDKPDSLNVYGNWDRVNAISEILTKKGDYKSVLVYRDSLYFYTDSIKKLDGTKQVEEIERKFHDKITRKNREFQILIWSSVSALAVLLIILFLVLKTLRLKKRQIELNDRISVLNSQIAGLMPKYDEDKEHSESSEEDVASITRLIEKKFELSLEMFRNLPEYESLRKLNLIREMSPDNKKEIKTVYDGIVGRFSGCCSDIRQAFPGMTNDDCIFCTMNFVGCSKEVISVAMGASEEALRRRKSRIKQKLPSEFFIFFFSK